MKNTMSLLLNHQYTTLFDTSNTVSTRNQTQGHKDTGTIFVLQAQTFTLGQNHCDEISDQITVTKPFFRGQLNWLSVARVK